MAMRQPPPAPGQSVGDRFLGVLQLDGPTYAAIKQDAAANGQAWLIVLLAGLLSGIGSATALRQAWPQLQTALGQQPVDPNTGQPLPVDPITLPATLPTSTQVWVIVFSILGAVLGWFIMAALAGWVGKTFFGGERAVSGEQLRRLIGWSYAPLLFNVLGRVPLLGSIVSLVVGVWAILTMVRALRTGLDLTTGKAVGTWLVASLLPAVVLGLLSCVALLAIAPLVQSH